MQLGGQFLPSHYNIVTSSELSMRNTIGSVREWQTWNGFSVLDTPIALIHWTMVRHDLIMGLLNTTLVAFATTKRPCGRIVKDL